jgi:hypothetical protein
MAKKKTRLEELEEYAKGVGLLVKTYGPGDGVTRYRFFEKKKVPADQSYFGPANGIHTALGLKKAWDFAYAYAAGAGR